MPPLDLGLEQPYPRPLAGVDEVGRGPLAGPVVAAAVIFDREGFPSGIRDSKSLSAKRREELDVLIRGRAVVGIGRAEVDEIDALNIHHATLLAMARAVDALPTRPAFVLVDGRFCPTWRCESQALVGGDACSPSIAAASIVAKVERDRIMARAALEHPHYGWEKNKAYPTPDHLAALARFGPTPLHRRSFAPVRAAHARFALSTPS